MAGPSSSELNALIRLLEFLFSQEAALYTGTADPLSVAQQEMGDVGEQLTPLTDALMQWTLLVLSRSCTQKNQT